jgi:riboflavin kinase/FMN adenylyltransferase
MWIAHDYRTARCDRETAVAIGNFDGVHRGHAALLDLARREAARFGGESVVFTFEPHPARVLAPERAPRRISGADRRLELFALAKVDGAVVQGFDRAFAAMTPEDFAREVLLGLRARVVLVGENFRFGRDRAGDGSSLVELGRALGFRAELLGPVTDDGAVISSTRVREALSLGQLDRVRAMLGRDFDFDGRVIVGDRRGRTLGFPTANLRTDVDALPADGVYSVRVSDAGEGGPWREGVMNLGVRPTFSAGRSIEVHLFDTEMDLYGRLLRVRCIERLREERRFAGLEALRAQIEQDVRDARASLARARRSAPDAIPTGA